MDRFTWEEAREQEKERLGREPTEAEIIRYMDSMNSN